MEIKTKNRLYIVGVKNSNEVFTFEGEMIFNAINVGLFRITDTDKVFENDVEAAAYRAKLLADIAANAEVAKEPPIKKKGKK